MAMVTTGTASVSVNVSVKKMIESPFNSIETPYRPVIRGQDEFVDHLDGRKFAWVKFISLFFCHTNHLHRR